MSSSNSYLQNKEILEDFENQTAHKVASYLQNGNSIITQGNSFLTSDIDIYIKLKKIVRRYVPEASYTQEICRIDHYSIRDLLHDTEECIKILEKKSFGTRDINEVKRLRDSLIDIRAPSVALMLARFANSFIKQSNSNITGLTCHHFELSSLDEFHSSKNLDILFGSLIGKDYINKNVRFRKNEEKIEFVFRPIDPKDLKEFEKFSRINIVVFQDIGRCTNYDESKFANLLNKKSFKAIDESCITTQYEFSKKIHELAKDSGATISVITKRKHKEEKNINPSTELAEESSRRKDLKHLINSSSKNTPDVIKPVDISTLTKERRKLLQEGAISS